MLAVTMIRAPHAKPVEGSAGVEEFDIREVQIALARVGDVARVNPVTAPELLATFNAAYIRAQEVTSWLQQEYLRAERELSRIRSIIVLDKAPDILKEKGLITARNPAGSEDLRQAVVDQDPEYIAGAEKCGQLRALYELMRGKADGVEMAYNAVKRLLQEQAFNFSMKTSAGGEGSAGIGDTVVVVERPKGNGMGSSVAGLGKGRV